MDISNVCILCRKKSADTKEHFIPKVIGGRLGVKILCNGCNSKYGSLLIETYKTDPMIKIAMENLKDTLPNLYIDYIKSSSFVGYGNDQKKVWMKRSKKDLYVKTVKNKGIIIADTREAPKILRNIITKKEYRKIIEPKALDSSINTLPNDIVIQITKNLRIKKTAIKRVVPALSTKPLESRSILLAAYEFLYLCCFGKQMLEDKFDFIRNSILNDKMDSRIEVNGFYVRKEYLPFHIMVCDKGEILKLKFIIFNTIYNTINIEGIKLINNNGHIFIDHLLEKKFYYNNNLEKAKKNIYYIF